MCVTYVMHTYRTGRSGSLFASYFLLLTSYFLLLTSYFLLRTSYFLKHLAGSQVSLRVRTY